MLRIEMLPARHGDCIWIEYGNPVRRILVDGGSTGTHKDVRKRIKAIDGGNKVFELLVVTHVDADHIGGVLKLIEQPPSGVSYKEVWFNGYRHLTGLEEFGPVQGEKLTTWLVNSMGAGWNAKLGKGPVVRADNGKPPQYKFSGGLVLTILGPTTQKLKDLKPVWEKECKKAGMDPLVEEEPPTPAPPGLEVFGPLNVDKLADEPFTEDPAEANGSSISLLLEHDGKRVLLGGDAHPSTLESAIDLLEGEGGTLKLDAFKLPHHGSKYNVSQTLLERVECRRYLFSSSGAYFKHPHKEGVARVIKYGGDSPVLFFNYRTKFNEMWDKASVKDDWGYTTHYGGPASGVGFTL